MARAYGSNAQLLGLFESTYGLTPSGNFRKLPFISSALGSVQGLIENDVLGFGRDPRAPMRDVVNVDGDVVVPVDVRNFGIWLAALLGAPSTANNNAAGWIRFNANPANTSTITINGTTFTFVAGTPSGNQIQIGATLEDTLATAVTTLNASVDEDVSLATYSHVTGSNTLDIVYDTSGPSGNSFTLAASAAVVSGATLTGGERFRSRREDRRRYDRLTNGQGQRADRPGQGTGGATAESSFDPGSQRTDPEASFTRRPVRRGTSTSRPIT